jgi:hypothetical protein
MFAEGYTKNILRGLHCRTLGCQESEVADAIEAKVKLGAKKRGIGRKSL